ncbi:tigger transposable element-derived protein 6-like protein, partial [Lasius niger]
VPRNYKKKTETKYQLEDLQKEDHPQDSLSRSVPLSDVVALPNLPQNTTKQTARKKHSIIITSTPIKKVLEKKQQNKNKKEQTEITKNEKTETKTKKGVRNLKNFQEDNQTKKTDEVPNKKKRVNKDADKENSYFCIYCNEKYKDPPIEDWIKCYKLSAKEYQIVELIREDGNDIMSIDCVPSKWVIYDEKAHTCVTKFMPPPYNKKKKPNYII